MSGHRKNKALLFSTVCIFLLCLLQAACAPNGEVDDPESHLIDPDKFELKTTEDTRATNSNIVVVKITPGSSGMALKEFWITVSFSSGTGIARGDAGARKGSKIVYSLELNHCSLENIFLQHVKCLGKDDTRFEQGKKVSFRMETVPGASIKEGDTYTLTVKVERKGNNPRTETQSIVLTAKQNGVDTKAQTEEASTSDTSAQTPATVLDTVSGNAMQSINHPTIREDLPVPTEEEHALDTNPQIPVSDTNLPATTNSTPPNTSAAQRTEVSDITEDDSPSSTNASAQQPASHQFTVTLSDATRCDGVRNFVLVTIKPNGGGMALKDFFVTASLSGSKGIAKGSSGPKGNGFVYSNALDKGNLEELFLTNQNSKCLGKDDTRFARGEEVAFRIEVKPGAAVGPGDQYMLTVEVAYTGSNPHTETESILLTATQKSPQKKKKRATPRK